MILRDTSRRADSDRYMCINTYHDRITPKSHVIALSRMYHMSIMHASILIMSYTHMILLSHPYLWCIMGYHWVSFADSMILAYHEHISSYHEHIIRAPVILSITLLSQAYLFLSWAWHLDTLWYVDVRHITHVSCMYHDVSLHISASYQTRIRRPSYQRMYQQYHAIVSKCIYISREPRHYTITITVYHGHLIAW